MRANGNSAPSPTVTPLYSVHSDGYNVDVFDARIVVLERRVGAGLSNEVERLAQLRERGALSDEEFAVAKRRILGET